MAKKLFITFAIILGLSFLGHKTFERNATFLHILSDTYSLDSKQDYQQSRKINTFYYEVEKQHLAILQSYYSKKQADTTQQLNKLIEHFDSLEKRQKDMRYFESYIMALDRLIDPIQTLQKEHNASYTITVDDTLFYTALENEKRIIGKALEAYKLSDDLKHSYLARLTKYHKAIIKAFRGDSLNQMHAMLQADQANTQSNKLSLLIMQEFLKTLQVDKVIPLTQTTQIKTSLLMLLTLPNIQESVKRYHRVIKVYPTKYRSN